ncbi:hypothetical protein [Plantibacter sp. ME-Dv--P-122b]|uniref:hypothetical protein n=1 Tax=Plantibacter sp. ME-Dv--P-122b TaxID=3040300 RepID=UPI00254BD75F|nr:hypothetical protein [Plantibacter sp. ME-Dv--P-122b]
MSDNEDEIVAIAYGRVVGQPEDENQETIQASGWGGKHTTLQESADVPPQEDFED